MPASPSSSSIPTSATSRRPVHGVVGYSQRNGTHKIGDYLLTKLDGKPAKVGVIEGLPGYHSTERVGGFLDAVKDKPGIESWLPSPAAGTSRAATPLGWTCCRPIPTINVVFAANDYMIIGVAQAAKALGKSDLMLLGNDGDTGAGLEPIAAGDVTATVNTTPFVMGRSRFQVTMDALNGKFAGGFVETPTTIVDKDNVLPVLQDEASLYPEAFQAATEFVGARGRSPRPRSPGQRLHAARQCPIGRRSASPSASPASPPSTRCRCAFALARSTA